MSDSSECLEDGYVKSSDESSGEESAFISEKTAGHVERASAVPPPAATDSDSEVDGFGQFDQVEAAKAPPRRPGRPRHEAGSLPSGKDYTLDIPLHKKYASAASYLFGQAEEFKPTRSFENLLLATKMRLGDAHHHRGDVKHSAMTVEYTILKDEVELKEVSAYFKGKCFLTPPDKTAVAQSMNTLDSSKLMPADTPMDFVMTERMFIDDYKTGLHHLRSEGRDCLLHDAIKKNSEDVRECGSEAVFFPVLLMRHLLEALMCSSSLVYVPAQIWSAAKSSKHKWGSLWKTVNRWPQPLMYIKGPLELLKWQMAISGCEVEREVNVDRLRRMCRTGKEVTDLWHIDVGMATQVLAQLMDQTAVAAATHSSNFVYICVCVKSITHIYTYCDCLHAEAEVEKLTSLGVMVDPLCNGLLYVCCVLNCGWQGKMLPIVRNSMSVAHLPIYIYICVYV
jgi:hypothetical protein